MAKTKEPTPIGQLATSIIADYSFEDKVHLFEVIKEDLALQTANMKKKIELADSTLNAIKNK